MDEAKGAYVEYVPFTITKEVKVKNINVGSSGLTASAIGVGCMRISELSVKEVARLVDVALGVGINLFDHADIYGGGLCEELFGKLFQEEPALREKLIIQSKCGIRQGYYDLSKSYILSATDNILRRLNTDYLDVLLLHRPDSLMEPEEIGEVFDTLHRQGKVKHFGVSNMNPGQIALLQAHTGHKIIANQMQFSIACSGMVDSGIHANVPNQGGDSRDESVLEYCRLKGITIQTWSPLQYGFFEGVFLGHEKYAKLNVVLDELAGKYGKKPSAIALAWILRHPANMQVITGSKSVERILQMAEATDVAMEREEWYEVYRAAGNILP